MQTADATLTVTAAVLDHVEITPDPISTDPRTTPDTFDLPRGASQTFYALYYYSDVPGVPVVGPRTAADKVVWSSSAPATVSIAPAADNARSEDRRVGKACVITCRTRWSPLH